MGVYPPAMRIFLRMIILGALLGAIAGFLSLFTISTSFYIRHDVIELARIIEGLFLSIAVGGIYGGFYGGVSGFLSGLAMAVISAILFSKIRNVHLYKFAMGALTALITGTILRITVLEIALVLDYQANVQSWIVAIVMSVVIAVYASQITARKYLREMSVRKQKSDGITT